MRQAQQNRRGRGRNRKGQNPLTRTYESNGPDVKIRGTPSHIAEKYVSMARDALSSGDPVLAENYLQHAEHYNRIIMAHREQQMADESRQGQSNPNGGGGRPRGTQDMLDDDGGDEEPLGTQNQPMRAAQEQPSDESSSAEGEANRGSRRGPSRNRNDDGERGGPRGGANARANGRGGRRPRYGENDDQPDFLKRPVRRRSGEEEGEQPSDPSASVEADQAAE